MLDNSSFSAPPSDNYCTVPNIEPLSAEDGRGDEHFACNEEDTTDDIIIGEDDVKVSEDEVSTVDGKEA